MKSDLIQIKNAWCDIVVSIRRFADCIFRCIIKRRIDNAILFFKFNIRRIKKQCSRCGKPIVGECYLLKGGKIMGRCCYLNPCDSIRARGEV